MRIAFFILSLRENGGGSQQNAIAFIRALRAHGHEVVVHTMMGEKGNNPPADIVPAFVSDASRCSFLGTQRMLTREMTRFDSEADIFFVSGPPLIWGAGMYRKTGKTPVVVYLDSHLDSMKEAHRTFGTIHRWKHRLWQRLFGLRLAAYVDKYLALSPYLADKYVQYGFPAKSVGVLPVALECEPIARVPSSGEPTILYAGRLSHEKGVDTLISALALLKGEKWHVRIVGGGPDRELLERSVKEHGLEKRIEFVSWLSRTELLREYASADILVVPSRVPEPFGITIVEAMAHGVPAVVPQYGGAAWVAGEAGVTFENENASSLATAIRTLLADSALRAQLGERGKIQARQFSVDKVGAQLSDTLEQIRRR